MKPQNEDIDLSVVATVYNDVRNVEPLVEEILTELSRMDISFEIILVNDASTDKSEEAISNLCDSNPLLKGLSLSRNCGQQIAMSAGIQYASGNYVLIMDGDLQNASSAIPTLYQKIREGNDIVYTVSKVRNNWMNELSSKLLWAIITKIFRIPMVPNQLMMRIMTSEFAERFNSYREVNRFVAAITYDIGMKCGVLEVENRRRTRGVSHYSSLKRLNLMLDLIVGLSVVPLNAMLLIGLLVFALTTIFSIYELFVYFSQGSVPGFTSIILSIFFFNSIIIVSLGLIGRYLANIYTEVRSRPLFFIKNTYNL